MSAVVDNLRVGGEGAHFDNRAAVGTATARLAETMSQMLSDAVRRGDNVRLMRSSGRYGTAFDTLAADALTELYGTEQDILFRACHLAISGKHEASTVALLEFIDTASKRFGTNAADALMED
jgi:hypothetical protein